MVSHPYAKRAILNTSAHWAWIQPNPEGPWVRCRISKGTALKLIDACGNINIKIDMYIDWRGHVVFRSCGKPDANGTESERDIINKL